MRIAQNHTPLTGQFRSIPAAIKDEYGSFDLYLSEALDISAEDIKAIRQNLLTDN
ncbi:tyrosine-protein phosphatase [Thalassobius sp. I31.1]|uniref:tyrosine-protein phosphatase n=1 Tax=Thalassobius sp. I31.1 TaxID=2109912 RepID=UPI00130047D9|nr:tyrosine-protein phosphatase [Thalassobius sp. I31.1]